MTNRHIDFNQNNQIIWRTANNEDIGYRDIWEYWHGKSIKNFPNSNESKKPALKRLHCKLPNKNDTRKSKFTILD